MKVTLDDALSLLSKYEEEQTPVLSVFATPSQSVARVTGTIHVSLVRGVPNLLVGEEDTKFDQIKFRLSDWSSSTAIFGTRSLPTSMRAF